MSNRRPQLYLQDREPITFSHAQVTGDKTTEFYSVPADRTLVIDRVLYVNPTGLAADDNNFAIVKLLNGSAVAAQWSTKTTGGDGALVADALNTLTLSGTAANINAAAGAKLKLFLDLTGTTTLPAGTIRVEGRLL